MVTRHCHTPTNSKRLLRDCCEPCRIHLLACSIQSTLLAIANLCKPRASRYSGQFVAAACKFARTYACRNLWKTRHSTNLREQRHERTKPRDGILTALCTAPSCARRFILP